MIRPFILKRLALICAMTLLILGGVGRICPASAQTAPQFDSSKAKLMDLGSEFMRDIGTNLKQSDLYLRGAGRFELAEQKSGSFVPNGEPMVLHAIIGINSVSGKQDIYTVKENDHLMISLADYMLALDFPVKVNPAAGTASGWIANPTQTFSFDLKNKQVAYAGKTFEIKPGDVKQDGNDLLISSDALEKWMSVVFDYDLSSLNLIISTPLIYPIETAYIRQNKGSRRVVTNIGAKFPPLEPEYGLVSIPYADIETSMNVFQSPGTRRTHSEDWSAILAGDYAGFNTNAYLGGTYLEPYLNSARISMGKEDPRGNLLGPLKANTYKFGDLATVSGSMIGSSALERGVFASNRGLNRNTTKTYTEINGDSHPGWDVELYRNDSYLDIRHVGADGRYDFGKVDLILGSNSFKLIYYSPQGERTEETRLVNVDPLADVGAGQGQYAVSLTQHGKNVYSRTPQTGAGVGDPHLEAGYDFGVRGLGTVSTELSSDTPNGVRRTLVESGLATGFWGTFYNGTIAYDTANSAFATALTARRNFGSQSLQLGYNHYSERFNPVSLTGATTKDSYNAGLSGPLLSEIFFLKNITYNASSTYAETYSGSTTWQSSGSLTTRIGNVTLNGGIQYSVAESDGSSSDASSAVFGARGRMFDGSWRLGAQYQVLPEKQLTSAEAEYSRSIAENLDSTSSITYEPLSRLTTGKIGLNWITSKAVISPSVQYDTNKNVAANVSVHFGLAADPTLSNIRLSSEYYTASGGVAARIFKDANGNGIFDDGDKLLPDASIVAIQGEQSATSGADGMAFIATLPKNVLTDITVDAGGSESAYGVSLFKGVAIMPHPGGVTRLDFPIVDSGEIDGQAETESTAPARGMTVSLIAPDGKVQKFANAEGDGYWSMSVVEPGTYYLTAETDETNPGYFIPRLMEFKPDGSTFFGQSVKLTKGYNTKFNFSATNEAPSGENHARVIRPSDIASQKFQLNVGAFHSRLAMTLAWYKLKLYSGRVHGGLDLAMPMAGMPADDKGIMSLVLNPGDVTTMEQGAAACQTVGEMNVGDCAVNVITTYRTPTEEKITPYRRPPAALLAKAPEKEQEKPDAVAMSSTVKPDIIVHPNRVQAETTTTISPALAADLADYAAANPAINKAALKEKTVLLNLGSYNSRTLMAVIWYKVKTRYTAMIGDATLLVRPTDSNASSQTGKYTLRVSLPSYNIDDANNRCRLLTAQGQFCTVEVLPSGLQASR